MWKDHNDREWSTEITVTTVKRVKQLADVLLTDAADSNLVERLYGDVLLLCDVLWAICEPEATRREVTAAAFGELLAGDTLDRACESLMRDLIDFFPRGRREIVLKIWQTAGKLEAERIKLLETKLTEQQLDELIQQTVTLASQQIDQHLAAHGSVSGNSLES